MSSSFVSSRSTAGLVLWLSLLLVQACVFDEDGIAVPSPYVQDGMAAVGGSDASAEAPASEATGAIGSDGAAATSDSQTSGKVTLCHRGRTIQVTPDEVAGHLGHGDDLGPCSPDEGEKPKEEDEKTDERSEHEEH